MVTYARCGARSTVSGIGIVSVFGTSHEAFRDALLAGATGIAPLRGFDTTGCRTTLAGEMTGFEPTAWVPPMKLRRLDRTGRLRGRGREAGVRGRARVASIPTATTPPACCSGTWTAGGQSTQQFLDALFRSGPTGAPALLFDSTVGNSAAGLDRPRIQAARAQRHGQPQGGVRSCAPSSARWISLREGRAAAVIAGGVDAIYETFFKAHDGSR